MLEAKEKWERSGGHNVKLVRALEKCSVALTTKKKKKVEISDQIILLSKQVLRANI